MGKESFQVGKAPRIVVTDCTGDLVIRPWMDLDVEAKGEYTVKQTEEQLSFESNGDLVLHVPEGANIHVEMGRGDVVLRSLTGGVSLVGVMGDLILGNLVSAKVGHVAGDMVVNNMSGPLAIQKVDGDLVVRNLDGDLALELISGDVVAKHVTGSLLFGEAMGDVNVRSVNGDVELIKGYRDVNLRNIGGQCTIRGNEGDIRLLGGLGPYDHSLVAGGDIVVTWPIEAPLLLEAEAARIVNRLPLLDVLESEGSLSGRLGDGKTRLSLNAGGRLVLKEAEIVSKRWNPEGDLNFDFDFVTELTNLGTKVASEVNEQVSRVTAELENNFGPDFMQRMSEQFSQKAAAAADMARKAAEAQSPPPKQKPGKRENQTAGAKGARKPDSSYEAQLKILKMVENGVISPDEANMLLEALQGD